MARHLVAVATAAVVCALAGCSERSQVTSEGGDVADAPLVEMTALVDDGFLLGPSQQLAAPFRDGWVLVNSWVRDDGVPHAVQLHADGRARRLGDLPVDGDRFAVVPAGDSVALLSVECDSCADEEVVSHVLEPDSLQWRRSGSAPLVRVLGEEGVFELLGHDAERTVVGVGGEPYVLGRDGALERLETRSVSGRSLVRRCLSLTDGSLYEVRFAMDDEQTRDGAEPSDAEGFMGRIGYIPDSVRVLSLSDVDGAWRDAAVPDMGAELASPQVVCGLEGPIIASPGSTMMMRAGEWSALDPLPAEMAGSFLYDSDVTTAGVVAMAPEPLRELVTLGANGWTLTGVPAAQVVASGDDLLAIRSDSTFEIVREDGTPSIAD